MKFRTLIPAAGFGTRVGMKPNESKEMMIVNGNPMIDWCLDFSINPLVIVRNDKRDLIDHLQKKNIDVHIISKECEENGEWMDSLLEAEERWGEMNCLVLPDTRFYDPGNAITRIFRDIVDCNDDILIGYHKVDDLSKWGALIEGKLIEKPNIQIEGKAWGVLGFKKNIGVELLKSFSNKEPYKLPPLNDSFQLKGFKDITRG